MPRNRRSPDKTRGIALDADGNVLLTGEFTGTATFGEHSVTSAGEMDFFVAKVDPRGTFLWVRSGGGEKIDRGHAVPHLSSTDIFLAKLVEKAPATKKE